MSVWVTRALCSAPCIKFIKNEVLLTNFLTIKAEAVAPSFGHPEQMFTWLDRPWVLS